MTIATSEKYIYIQTNAGTVAIPYAAPSEGEPYINFPDGAGGFIAHKYSAPAEGDPFVYLPTNDGRFVALSMGVVSTPLPNELNLRVYTFPTVTTQHFWLADWDSVAGSYDGTYVEYSTAGFSTNYGEGTKICEVNSLVSACNAWTINPNSMHYFTAWGVSSTTPVSTSRSCAKLADVSQLTTHNLSEYSTGTGLGKSILTLDVGCTGSVSQTGDCVTISFSGGSSLSVIGFSLTYKSYWNDYAKGVTFDFTRSDSSLVAVGGAAVARDIWATTTESVTVFYYPSSNVWGSHSETFANYADSLGFGLSAVRTTKPGSYTVTIDNITWTSS